MSLGVLNNISAIYAENNLNQTQAGLQNTLTQLSSGSRINFGADDAAGLSLASGLGANSVALTQSSTNAAEGVGLLQVADGALSQVTNLLNRAITLATEASNGTLNTAQDSAANSEFQSILDEISNIGSTTTYNGQQVFGGSFQIFTGDGTKGGGFADTITLGALSSTAVGDSTGSAGLTYTSGAGTATSTLTYTPVAADSVKLSVDDLTSATNAQSGTERCLHCCAGRGSGTRLHRRTDQHVECSQQRRKHRAGERGFGTELHPGDRLRFGHLEPLEVRNPEPDRHQRSGPGQQHRATGYKTASVVRQSNGRQGARHGSRLSLDDCGRKHGVPHSSHLLA